MLCQLPRSVIKLRFRFSYGKKLRFWVPRHCLEGESPTSSYFCHKQSSTESIHEFSDRGIVVTELVFWDGLFICRIMVGSGSRPGSTTLTYGS
jgi:hypothetical protein